MYACYTSGCHAIENAIDFYMKDYIDSDTQVDQKDMSLENELMVDILDFFLSFVLLLLKN